MGEIASQISAKRTEISLLQASIIILQKACEHRMVFSKQEKVHCGLDRKCKTLLVCEECGIEKTENEPYCEVHKIKMILANDEESRRIQAEEHKNPNNAYYYVCVHKCPQCDERKLTQTWDQ